MSRLVAQLLSLARNEPTTMKQLELAPLDLSQLAFDVTTEWVPEAYRKNIDLGFEGVEPHAMIRGDATRLTELIEQPARQRHSLYAQRWPRNRARHRRIRRAYRSATTDRSFRSRSASAYSSGFTGCSAAMPTAAVLGLRSSSEIAKLHDAKITLAEDADGLGNTFTVTFPDSAQPSPVKAARKLAVSAVAKPGVIPATGPGNAGDVA